jgi:hypothetical protein
VRPFADGQIEAAGGEAISEVFQRYYGRAAWLPVAEDCLRCMAVVFRRHRSLIFLS